MLNTGKNKSSAIFVLNKIMRTIVDKQDDGFFMEQLYHISCIECSS